ncbi:lycopene cyclase domain-containing protein [Pedobacter gandavensis]|uniref:Lycopene cyclase domain-containing protein n=1 Tax=Pedobacter gandavensis TaxID=2679963 RepID=A0ABR6EWR2_9SPHI|nr:lycopene cyclase domain-containing protein [Pedobacter gandavensis]MBB2149723.1 lycopene cyclase domain-containing protein [Pedobacter gandavensis]
MNLTYLLLALGMLIVPILLLLVKKTNFYQTIKFALPAVVITGLIFSFFATLFVIFGAWDFNPSYLSGTRLWIIPIEEFLFYMTSCLAGISIYQALNVFFPNNALDKFSLSFSNLMLGICIAMLFFAHLKWYSTVSFGVLFVLIFYIEYLNKLRFSYQFYRGYLVSLVLFYIGYGIISVLPVISYKDTLDLRIGAIPFESHFYFMGMLLLSVYFYEWFKSRFKA